jgi:phage recombination protein Bet
MSTELDTYSGAVEASGYNQEQLDLIKRTFAAGTNDLEFALFMETANRTGLSPLAKQIYAVKRWSKKDKREVMSIQTGIDGYRLIADRTGLYDGHDGPFWCGADGVWREVWFDNAPPKAAKVVVYKRGSTRGFPGVAHWREYVQLDRDENPTRFWANMPATMLAKCAESLALRKAFPQELSGLYTVDEMAQAEQESGPAEGMGRPLSGSDHKSGRSGSGASAASLDGASVDPAATPADRTETPEFGPPDSGGPTAPTPGESTSQGSGAAANDSQALGLFKSTCEALGLRGIEAVELLAGEGWDIPDPWWQTVAGWSSTRVMSAGNALEKALKNAEVKAS